MTIRIALVAVLVLLSTRPAAAQDRLFIGVLDDTPGGRRVEVGALGRFGEPLGPAPAEAFTRRLPRVQHFYAATATTIVETGTFRTVFEAPPGATISGWTATEDATRVFVASYGPGFSERRLQAIDVATGAVVANVVPDTIVGSLTWVPGDRIVAEAGLSDQRVFDRDLNELARFSLGNACQPQWMVSAHTGRAYVVSTGGYSQNFLFSSLLGFDTIAGVKVGDVSLNSTFGVGRGSCYSFGAVLWTAPGRPQRFAATVSGREVALSWLATDLAEGYVLDVGVAPGRSDASIYVGQTTRVIFVNPPSGTYFVRVRAGNVMGGGRPSAEIRVDVP